MNQAFPFPTQPLSPSLRRVNLALQGGGLYGVFTWGRTGCAAAAQEGSETFDPREAARA
ncbi:MAG: hypothetical protein JJD98_17705 [Polaromonas sp.]|nr:hypothetical protein [Polaromonas sp.]